MNRIDGKVTVPCALDVSLPTICQRRLMSICVRKDVDGRGVRTTGTAQRLICIDTVGASDRFCVAFASDRTRVADATFGPVEISTPEPRENTVGGVGGGVGVVAGGVTVGAGVGCGVTVGVVTGGAGAGGTGLSRVISRFTMIVKFGTPIPVDMSYPERASQPPRL